MTQLMDPLVARKMHRTLEAYHGMIYFVPEAAEAYRRLGARHERTGYFASRAAPMGAVDAEVVVATFFNFHPALVRAAMADAWELAAPAEWTAARRHGVDASLQRFLGGAVTGPEMARAAELARRAAEACWSPGRPLAAGLLAQPWPEPAHLVLWQAISIIREFRGDGHIAALVAAGVEPLAALVHHAGTGAVPAAVLRATRAWPEDAWDRAVEEERAKGLIDAEGRLTPQGTARRDLVEAQTDAAALAPWSALGENACDELRALVRPMSQAIVAGGAFAL